MSADAPQLRAEMASARGRVERNLNAVEAELWQRADDALGPTPDVRRRRLGVFDVVTNAVLYAKEHGWLRRLWDRTRRGPRPR